MAHRSRNSGKIMETNPSFDLNRAIETWRANLAQSPAFRSDNLYELETHLRDSIATLERQGLTTEEAFLVALKRIGKGRALEAEFAKQNARSVWLDRALWVLIGSPLWLLAGSLSQYLQIFLGLGTSKFTAWLNEGLTTYGLSRIPESAGIFLAMIGGFPLTLLLGVTILFQANRWAKRRGWDVPRWLLQRPKWLAGMAAIIILSPTILSPLMYKLISWGDIERVQRYSFTSNTFWIGLTVNTLLFMAIVHALARHRLRLGKV